jgi:hypothetical protein
MKLKNENAITICEGLVNNNLSLSLSLFFKSILLVSTFCLLTLNAKANDSDGRKLSVGVDYSYSSINIEGPDKKYLKNFGGGLGLSFGYKFSEHIGLDLGYSSNKNSVRKAPFEYEGDNIGYVESQLKWTTAEINAIYYFSKIKGSYIDVQMFALAGLSIHKATVESEAHFDYLGYEYVSTIKDSASSTGPQIGFGGKIYLSDGHTFFKGLFKYSTVQINYEDGGSSFMDGIFYTNLGLGYEF